MEEDKKEKKKKGSRSCKLNLIEVIWVCFLKDSRAHGGQKLCGMNTQDRGKLVDTEDRRIKDFMNYRDKWPI